RGQAPWTGRRGTVWACGIAPAGQVAGEASTRAHPGGGPKVVAQRPRWRPRAPARASQALAGRAASHSGSQPNVALAARAWGSEAMATAARNINAMTRRSGQSG